MSRGVCALVDQWIQQVAFLSFRDSVHAPISWTVVLKSEDYWFCRKVRTFSSVCEIEGVICGQAPWLRVLWHVEIVFPSDAFQSRWKKVLPIPLGVISRLALLSDRIQRDELFGNNSSGFQNVKMPSWQRSANRQEKHEYEIYAAPKKNTNNNNYKTTKKKVPNIVVVVLVAWSRHSVPCRKSKCPRLRCQKFRFQTGEEVQWTRPEQSWRDGSKSKRSTR